MKLPLIVFFILLVAISFIKWRASRPKKLEPVPTKEPASDTKKEKKERKWVGTVVWIIILATVGTAGWYGYPYINQKISSKSEEKIMVVLAGNQYKSVTLPYYHWFDLFSNANFRVRLMNGKTFDFLAGKKYPKLDNEILGARLEFKSLTGKTEKIQIFLRRK